MTILLLACSQLKLPYRNKARFVYRGVLFRYALAYAEKQGWRVRILSGKYGWLDPDDVIEPYTERIQKPWTGPWPRGRGYWVGSKKYFDVVPDRFQPLLSNPNWVGGLKAGINGGIGDQKKMARQLLRGELQ